jgi:hypothetical protein
MNGNFQTLKSDGGFEFRAFVSKPESKKLYNEHIYWDQGSVLVQIGLLPRDGLPVTGIEATQKLLNEQLPSNLLMKNCLFRRLDAPPFPGEGARIK